jgi:hypothetical protein
MYIVIRKYTKVRSVADAARRAKSGIGQILRKSHGFKSYYVLDGGAAPQPPPRRTTRRGSAQKARLRRLPVFTAMLGLQRNASPF